jgi:hypothetical protein
VTDVKRADLEFVRGTAARGEHGRCDKKRKYKEGSSDDSDGCHVVAPRYTHCTKTLLEKQSDAITAFRPLYRDAQKIATHRANVSRPFFIVRNSLDKSVDKFTR